MGRPGKSAGRSPGGPKSGATIIWRVVPKWALRVRILNVPSRPLAPRVRPNPSPERPFRREMLDDRRSGLRCAGGRPPDRPPVKFPPPWGVPRRTPLKTPIPGTTPPLMCGSRPWWCSDPTPPSQPRKLDDELPEGRAGLPAPLQLGHDRAMGQAPRLGRAAPNHHNVVSLAVGPHAKNMALPCRQQQDTVACVHTSICTCIRMYSH